MAAAAAIPPRPGIAIIDNVPFGVNRNPEAKYAWYDPHHLIKYEETSNGAFRTMQLMSRVMSAAILVLKEMGSDMVEAFERAAGKIGLAWAMLCVPRLPQVTFEGYQALVEPADLDMCQRMKNIAGCIATWLYAASLVIEAQVRDVADLFDLGENVMELPILRREYNVVDHYATLAEQGRMEGNDAVNPLIRQRLVDTRTHIFMKLVKVVCSVATGTLALVGIMLAPASALAIGTIGTVAAFSAHFFKVSRASKLVDANKLLAASALPLDRALPMNRKRVL